MDKYSCLPSNTNHSVLEEEEEEGERERVKERGRTMNHCTRRKTKVMKGEGKQSGP